MDIKSGEIICDKCGGTGTYGHTTPDRNMCAWPKRCPKCLGHGKVDWIENIVGKPKPKPKMFDICAGSGGGDESWVNKMYEGLATDLAEKIDKEIIETLIAEATHPEKMMNVFGYHENILKKE